MKRQSQLADILTQTEAISVLILTVSAPLGLYTAHTHTNKQQSQTDKTLVQQAVNDRYTIFDGQEINLL